ncbi:MAG: SRPBCC domain-containing protein [Bacteroidales bacterium]|nr:SRPBCC domain-containing protein [Bacteroidales bacterium]
MKNIITLIFIISGYINCQAQEIPEFLQGKWKVENKDIYEEWEMVTTSEYVGSSYKIIDDKKVVSENLSIRNSAKSVIYTATVLNQNQGKGIEFTLNKIDANTFSFENLNHDFPKKIIYKKIADRQIYVQVLGKENKGFSFNMFKVKTDIPKWYFVDLENQIGVWEADNNLYKSENEPFEKYVIEWNWGVDTTSINGRLYGKIGDKASVNFWEFKQYWDAEDNQAKLFQVGFGGLTGIGSVMPINKGETSVVQNFTEPSTKGFTEKHRTIINGQQKTTTSFEMDSLGNWIEKRTYVWNRKEVLEKAKSQIDTLPSGELMLTQTININASVDKVWNLYTTPEGWKKWVTPVVEMDFKINGTIKSHYDSTATVGDKGTIVNNILNYIPYQQITMQAELNENFPEFMIGEEKNLYSIVDFEKLDLNKTRLTIYGIGYKNEQQWRDLLKFFIQANEMTLNKLKKYLEE